MTREQIAEEIVKCFPVCKFYTDRTREELVQAIAHILRIGTTELREENKRLRSGEYICPSCHLRKDADPFFKDGVPF